MRTKKDVYPSALGWFRPWTKREPLALLLFEPGTEGVKVRLTLLKDIVMGV